jgi:GTP-binding protein EngB required for normal cell division
MPETLDSGLNDSHNRRLAAILTDIEENLVNVERAAVSTGASPFAQTSPDLTPTQQQVVADYLGRIREIIVGIAPRLGRHAQARRVSASWSIQNALHFVDIAIAEMGASYLRGYGGPGPEGVATLERMQSELRRPVLQLRAYLEQDLGRDPAARLARLQDAPVDLGLLRTLERIIRERGLVDLRPALEALLQQLESPDLEIAVFGRVSSGKSSLLNTVLGTDLLPVGVTPVTTVPTRIRWGERPVARISFAEQPDETIPIARLPEFVSEAGNPENAKRVTRASVEAPLERLRGSVAFVDTPGIGALRISGERQTRSYLPRCDLGVLLIDGALMSRDLELLRLLYESGIPGIVALSKGDLIAEPDRNRITAHAETEIRRALSLDLQVGIVSSAAHAVALAQHWFETEIAPRLHRARALRDESTRRKLAHLRESAAAILRVYLRRGAASDPDELQELEAQAQVATADGVARTREFSANADAFSELVIREVAGAFASNPLEDARGVILGGIRGGLERARRETEQRILDARDRLRTLLAQMGGLAEAPVHTEDIRLDLSEVPSLEPHIGAVEVRPPRGLFKNLAIRSLERTLLDEFGAGIENAFRRQAQDLAAWAKHQIAHLEQQFSSQARPLLARSRAGSSQRQPSEIAGDLRALGYDT